MYHHTRTHTYSLVSPSRTTVTQTLTTSSTHRLRVNSRAPCHTSWNASPHLNYPHSCHASPPAIVVTRSNAPNNLSPSLHYQFTSTLIRWVIHHTNSYTLSSCITTWIQPRLTVKSYSWTEAPLQQRKFSTHKGTQHLDSPHSFTRTLNSPHFTSNWNATPELVLSPGLNTSTHVI